MKKVVIVAMVFAGLHVAAQEKNLTAALEALGKKNYDEAKTLVDEACTNSETKDKPKTLFTKVRVYDKLQ